jgi:hypothetical protein
MIEVGKVYCIRYNSVYKELILVTSKLGNDVAKNIVIARNVPSKINNPHSLYYNDTDYSEVKREDLPLYLGWPAIAPEFTEVLNGTM